MTVTVRLPAGAAPAPAEPGGGQGGRMLDGLDRAGHGAAGEAGIRAPAPARVAPHVAKMFARMERNGDGRVERAELEAAGEARLERMRAAGDGLVSIAEVRARWQARRHGHMHGGESEARPEN